MPDQVRVELFAVFYVSASNVYACGEGGVILRSTNGGQDWSDINPNNRVLDALDNPAKLQDIFMFSSGAEDAQGWVVGYDGAIAYTDDNWTTWTRPDADNSSDLPSQYTDEFEPDPDDIYDIHFFYDNDLTGNETHWQYGIFCGDLTRVYLTSDSGDSWTTAASLPGGSFLCPDQHYIELWAMSFADPEDPASDGILVGGQSSVEGYIFRTANGGQSWTQTHCYDMLHPSLMASQSICAPATFYDAEWIGSSNPLAIAAGYAQDVFLSTTSAVPDFDPCSCAVSSTCSGSEVWSELDAEGDSEDPVGEDPPILGTALIDGGNACLVGWFGRIMTLDYDGGPGGTPLFVDRGTVHHNRLRDGAFIDDANDDTGVVVGQGWSVWRTVDGGEEWAQPTIDWTPNSANWANGVALSTASTPGEYGVMVGTGEFIAISSNAGATWTRLVSSGVNPPIPEDFPDLNAVAFVPNSSTVFAVGQFGTVMKSTDNGATWVMLTDLQDEATHLQGVSFIDANVGYVCGLDGKTYKTTNGGAQFTPFLVNGSPATDFYDIEAWSATGGDGTAAIVVGAGGAVYEKTPTATRFWPVTHTTTPEITEDLVDVEVLGTGTTVRIGGLRGGALFRDSGTWSAPKTNTTFPLYKMSFQSASHGFGVGSAFVVLQYRTP